MSILKCYYCEVFAHIPVKYQQQKQKFGRFSPTKWLNDLAFESHHIIIILMKTYLLIGFIFNIALCSNSHYKKQNTNNNRLI